MLRKAMVSPLEDIDKIKELYINLIDSEEFSEITVQVAESEGLSIQQGTNY